MKSRQEMFLCEESEEEKKMLRKTLDSRGVMDVNHTKSRVCSGTNALHSRPGSVWKVENLITYIFNLLSSFFSYNENLCKFTQMHSLHAYRGSAYTRMGEWRAQEKHRQYTRDRGKRSEHLLDLSICIHFSSIILCKSFFGCASYISIRLIWKWADKREIRDSCDGYTGSSSIPLDSRVGQDYATWKLHKITNENFSWWKYVCHNENEIGYKFKQLVGTIKYNWKILGRFLGNHSFD